MYERDPVLLWPASPVEEVTQNQVFQKLSCRVLVVGEDVNACNVSPVQTEPWVESITGWKCEQQQLYTRGELVRHGGTKTNQPSDASNGENGKYRL